MATDFTPLLAALPVPPPRSVSLRRFVTREALASLTPPDFLHTTGYAYRVNTDASRALYGAEDAPTAGAEWERQAARSPRLLSQVLYFIEINLPVLDLGDAITLAALHLTQADLRQPWQFAPSPTRLQLLGDAVARRKRFGAVRFPSDAARVRGFEGCNNVIFPSALVTPQSVLIRDDAGKVIQSWL